MQLVYTIFTSLLITISWTGEGSTIDPERNTLPADSDTVEFRDLNKNGKLDRYEDSSANIEIRIQDLLSQMTLEEKAGMLFINGAPVNEDASLEKQQGTGFAARLPAAIDNMSKLKMTHFNLWAIPADPSILAKWYSNLQRYAEQTRLGIPVTIASDPRHAESKNRCAV